jgi:cytochrome c553
MKKTLFVAALGVCFAGNAFAADAEAGKKLVTEKNCVGESPVSPHKPKLAGQHYDYLEKALSDYKSGKRKNPVMSAMVTTLTQQDIENLAAWFSSQQGLHTK